MTHGKSVVVPRDLVARLVAMYEDYRKSDLNHACAHSAFVGWQDKHDDWKALSSALAAAPAPSSLAGGVVERLNHALTLATGRQYAEFVLPSDLRAILAALSPEAPAREVSYQDLLDADVSERTIEDKTGEGWSLKDIAEEHCPELLADAVPEPTDILGVLTFYADGFDWHPGDGEAPDATHPGSAPTFYEASARTALLEDGGHLARQALAALTPRHEAPAEGSD